MTEQQSTAHS